jgi:TctA family transporter
MIQRRGEAGASRSVTGLKHAFEQQLLRVRSRIVQQNIAALDIHYAAAIVNPAGVAAALAAFLPGFNAASAASSVDPSLHRERVPED